MVELQRRVSLVVLNHFDLYKDARVRPNQRRARLQLPLRLDASSSCAPALLSCTVSSLSCSPARRAEADAPHAGPVAGEARQDRVGLVVLAQGWVAETGDDVVGDRERREEAEGVERR